MHARLQTLAPVTAGLLIATGLVAAPPAAAAGTCLSFGTETASTHSCTVEDGESVRIIAKGGNGGRSDDEAVAGKGAQVTATYTNSTGSQVTLHVFVGESGDKEFPAGGGGGFSSVSIGNDFDSTKALVIAAGGGGAGGFTGATGGDAGVPGSAGSPGAVGAYGGRGGSALGVGGAGGAAPPAADAGGAGGNSGASGLAGTGLAGDGGSGYRSGGNSANNPSNETGGFGGNGYAGGGGGGSQYGGGGGSSLAQNVTGISYTSSYLAPFVTIGAVPTVTAITPNSGTTVGGTEVEVTGTGFLAGATVEIGGVACTSVTIVSTTSLTCTTGAHAVGAVDVVVTNTTTFEGTGSGLFTYAAPTFTSISPSRGTTAGGTSVTITGDYFGAGATVTLGGVAATSVVVVDEQTITAATPANPAGAVDVAVTNTDTLAATGTSAYTYVTPSSGGGGGPAPAPTPTPTPTPTATDPTDGDTTETPSTGPGSLDLVDIPVTRDVPAGGAAVLVDGNPSEVRQRPGRKDKATVLRGADWSLRIGALKADGARVPLNAKNVVVVRPRQSIRVQGKGFAPRTVARVFIVEPARDLGTVRVRADGTFDGSFPLPKGLRSGTSVVQVNGYSPAMAVRSASLGIRIRGGSDGKTRGSTVVYFDAYSDRLDSSSRDAIRALVDEVPDGARNVAVSSLGYVQPTSDRSNDAELSQARADSALAYAERLLRPRFPRVEGTARGDGRGKRPTPEWRRAKLTITFDPPAATSNSE